MRIETAPMTRLLQERMDTSSHEKFSDICLAVALADMREKHPVILSLGAGTGKVERYVAMNYPHMNVVAADVSLPMLEEIQKNAMTDSGRLPNLSILRCSIDRLPIAPASVDFIIASSVVHEIASFRDHGHLGIHTEHFYQQIARRLKLGGVFFIRDFVQPDTPEKLVDVRIGKTVFPEDTDPKTFVDRFSQEFKATDLRGIRSQIEILKRNNAYGEGGVLTMSYADAIEMGAHYSWSKRFNEEVKERYAYLPLKTYGDFIQENFRRVGVETAIIQQYAYLQSGYPQHVDGRLDIYRHGTNEPLFLSPFTGVMAFRRIN